MSLLHDFRCGNGVFFCGHETTCATHTVGHATTVNFGAHRSATVGACHDMPVGYHRQVSGDGALYKEEKGKDGVR